MYDALILNLIDKLAKLPGVGPKSAARLAFYLLEADPSYVTDLTEAISQAKESIKFCDLCGNTSSETRCQICSNPSRDRSLLCVVEETRDLVAIEKTREFRGTYLVLGGALNPLAGVGIDDLRFALLMRRLAGPGITEVILAMNPNVEGEATAAYTARLVGPLGLRLTRIATGLPMGGDLEYADETTLGRAIESRREFSDEIF